MSAERILPSRSAAAEEATVACPHCHTGRARQVSPFGMFLFTARYRCTDCGAEFEQVRLQSRAGNGDGTNTA